MLRIEQLEKEFRETILTYPTLEFEFGKSYLLLGASGSGKSTLLNMLAGITSPTSGSIILDDTDYVGMTKQQIEEMRAKDIGYIFQDFKLIEDLTVEDNIRIMEMIGCKSQRIEQISRALGIADKLHRKVRTLSGGEKQRVAIARAVVKNPSIVLADEPTGSLNSEIAGTIIKSLIALTRSKLLILATHDTRWNDKFDHIIDLSKGEVT